MTDKQERRTALGVGPSASPAIDPAPLALADPEESAREAARAREALAENAGLAGKVAALHAAIDRAPEARDAPLSERKESVAVSAAPPSSEPALASGAPRVLVARPHDLDARADAPGPSKPRAHTTTRVERPTVGDAEASPAARSRGNAAAVVGVACVVLTGALVAYFVWRSGLAATTPSATPPSSTTSSQAPHTPAASSEPTPAAPSATESAPTAASSTVPSAPQATVPTGSAKPSLSTPPTPPSTTSAPAATSSVIVF